MNFNQQIHDEITIHSILLLDYIRGLQKKSSKTIFDTSPALRLLLLDHLSDLPRFESLNSKQWRNFAKRLETIIKAPFAILESNLMNESSLFVKHEAEYITGLFREISPVLHKWNKPKEQKPESEIIMGMTTTDRFQELAENHYKSILLKTKSLFRAGYSVPAIVTAIAGIQSRNYAGSSIGTANNHAKTIVNTTISGMAETSLQGFIVANQDVMGLYGDTSKQEVFVAVLDALTTPICAKTDGKVFAIGKGLYPPLHYNCRSRRYPIINGVALAGGRIFYYRDGRSYARKDFVADAKIIYDDWAIKSDLEKRIIIDKMKKEWAKNFIGGVPSNYNYEAFLKNQSQVFQERVLGKQKAKLFREGKLSLDKFSDRSGRALTLKQLSDMYSDSFSMTV